MEMLVVIGDYDIHRAVQVVWYATGHRTGLQRSHRARLSRAPVRYVGRLSDVWCTTRRTMHRRTRKDGR